MPDKTLNCEDCGSEFIFSESEQEFYKEKGLQHEPKRCGDCRKKRKNRRNEGRRGSFSGGGRTEKRGYEIVCSACGVTTTVPFKPQTNAPVYCRPCFEKQRAH